MQAKLEQRVDSGCRNLPQVDCKSKYRIVVINSSEVGVLSIGQSTGFDELASDIHVCARLMGKILIIFSSIIPITPISLLIDFGELELLLSPDSVVSNTACRVRALIGQGPSAGHPRCRLRRAPVMELSRSVTLVMSVVWRERMCYTCLELVDSLGAVDRWLST